MSQHNVNSTKPRKRVLMSSLGRSFATLWSRLTDPAPSIIRAEHRRRARLLSALLLSVILLSLPDFLLENPQSAPFRLELTTIIILGIAYVVSRSRHFVAAASLALGSLSLLPFAVVIIGDYSAESLRALHWLFPPIVLGSILLPLQELTILISATTIGLVLLPLSIPVVTWAMIIQPFGIHFTLSILLFVAAAMRHSDMKQIKQQSQELTISRDQALAASRFKSDLVAKVSHDFRTPLSAILGYTELLQANIYGPLSDKQYRLTTEVINGADYLNNLVNELLDQAQLETGRLRLDIDTFSLREMVQQVEAKMRVLAEAKELSFHIAVAADMPADLAGDQTRLKQIMINLISNAIKFTSSGQVQVKVYRFGADYWGLDVVDTGPGIPAEATLYIFEPFRQVDGSITRARNGTGLGLSIVKQLVEAMAGEVSVASQVGHGSTFTVTLPLQPPKES